MKRTFTTVVALGLLLSLSTFLIGPATSAQGSLDAANTSDLLDIATNPERNPQVRSAAADVMSVIWGNREQPGGKKPVSADQLFSLNGKDPSPTPEGRRIGLETQRSRILSEQDPLIGKPLTGQKQQDGKTVPVDNSQLYADQALAANAPDVTIERRYVRAVSVVFNIRSGFAIVGGGPAEAFRRIQTCIVDGSLKSSEKGNTVNGVKLDCSSEAVRRAISDFIAGGFYTNFGNLPAVDFGCDARLKQAESGPTVAARWAAARSYVQACVENSQQALADLAGNGGSAELQFAAVAPLTEILAETPMSTKQHLDAVTQFTGNQQPRRALANAWAAGLKFDQDLVNEDTTISDIASLTALADGAGVAAFASYYANQVGLETGNLPLTITSEVNGAELPLMSSVRTLSQ